MSFEKRVTTKEFVECSSILKKARSMNQILQRDTWWCCCYLPVYLLRAVTWPATDTTVPLGLASYNSSYM